jgi:long-subunit fatty acid transport protein
VNRLAIVGSRGMTVRAERCVRFVAAALCLAVCASLAPAPTWASALLAPAVGAADNATMGTRIADPHTPSAALFENPAGLTGFDTLTHGGGFGIAYGRAKVEASVPAGYDESDDVLPVLPDFGLSVPYRERWRFALGSYGTTGSKFDFEADPSLGVPSFFSETIVIAFPLGVAYRLSRQVSIGAEIQPMFGQLRTHFTVGGLPFHYKINGPGVQGMVGVAVRPTEQWAFGLSLRTPGMIWMGGSMPVLNVGRQRVHVDAQMPTQVLAGATWHCRQRLTLSGSVRFTDSSSLGDSTIEYELTPQANSGLVPYSKDEWKLALAAEYALRAETVLRLGVGWASRIVGSKGVSPLVFDGDDTMIGIGVGQRFGHWVLDAMAGYALLTERTISPSTALILPGEYSMQGAIFMLGMTYRQ